MGDWGEEFNALLNGEEPEIRTPGDISKVLDRENSYWHPTQVRNVERQETIDREYASSMNKAIATAYEQHFADDYQSEKADRGHMDVRLTFTPKAQNWSVQVKSCNYFRKAQDSVRTGSFTFRKDDYQKMEEKSFIQFYVGQTFFDDERDFEGEVIQVVNDEGREAYVEKVGQMLVPKHVFDQHFEPDWNRSGTWNLKWTEVFGEVPAESPIFGFTFENYSEINNEDLYKLSDFKA
ncbi:MAG: hypothetical protein H8Z69_05860 [Nanohaloarchaea archaeon]|nr:hypothetical protein [Candidatus Nanohaloarchaea archaeon]